MVNDDGIIRSKEGYLKICNEECNNSFCCETRQNIEIHDHCDLCGTKFSRFKAIWGSTFTYAHGVLDRISASIVMRFSTRNNSCELLKLNWKTSLARPLLR